MAILLHPRPARAGRFRLCVASERPAYVTVSVDDVPVTRADVRPGGPRCRTTPISAAVSGHGGRLALVNDSSATVYLEDARLADARQSFAWAHFGRTRLPAVPALLLAGSLVAVFGSYVRGAEAARPGRLFAQGAAVISVVVLVGLAVVGRPASPVSVPRGVWVTLPWILIGLGRPWRQARARPPLAARIRTLTERVLLVLVGVAVAILGAEVLARIATATSPPHDPRAAFRHAPPVPERNALGFRERSFSQAKPAGTYRIAVLGDSLTWGVGVPASADRFEQPARAPPQRATSWTTAPTYEGSELRDLGLGHGAGGRDPASGRVADRAGLRAAPAVHQRFRERRRPRAASVVRAPAVAASSRAPLSQLRPRRAPGGAVGAAAGATWAGRD